MTPFRQILFKGGRLAKSLTFWSIVIGLLLALDVTIVVNLYRIWRQSGFEAALVSVEYKFVIILSAVTLILLFFFYIFEREQNNEAQQEVGKIVEAIEVNTEELKNIGQAIVNQQESLNTIVGLSITIQQLIHQNGATNTQSQPDKNPIDENVITQKLDNTANEP